jgi:hypothetical protein
VSRRPPRPALGVREKKIRIFFFAELSPEAQKRAIEKFQDDHDFVWDQSDSDFLTDSFEEDLDDHFGLGDDMKVEWSLGYVQRDGVCFQGAVDVPKFIKTENLEKEFGFLKNVVSVHISHARGSCYHGSMDVELDIVGDPAPADAVETLERWEAERNSAIRKWRRDLDERLKKRSAPILEWEERVRERQRRAKGPLEWTPLPGPKPEPLDLPLPPEPVFSEPPEVADARRIVDEARKSLEKKAEEFREFLEERVEEISRELQKNGYQEIEYHNSEEYVRERLENLDFEFLEDGRLYKGD